jgi:hypothetical protein
VEALKSRYSQNMAIQDPKPRYSRQDKRLIALLAQLVVEARSIESGGNAPRGTVLLSDAESRELVDLLEQLLASGEFLEETYFIENIHRSGDPRMQRTFEAARSRRGRAKAMGWLHYNEFQSRFWTGSGHSSSTQPMEFEYFMQMEERLLREIGIHPDVRALVLRLLDQHRRKIEGIRAGHDGLVPGSIRIGFERILQALKLPTGAPPIRPERVAGAMTLVANLGCLFTSRDWSVAGTISAIGGAAVLTIM